MKNFINSLIVLLITHSFNAQTLTAPVPQEVYGGTIGDIETWAFSADSVYVVVATESANSIFYAKASRTSSVNNLNWTALPSADVDDGFGDLIDNIEIHQNSSTIFFTHQSNLYSTLISSSSVNLIDSMVKSFLIEGDTMFLVKNNLMAGGVDTL